MVSRLLRMDPPNPGGAARVALAAALVLTAALGTGCATVSVHTQPYAGVPHYPATDAAQVEILTAEPTRPKARLGEIILTVEGDASRTMLEHRIQQAAAELGANAAFIVVDETRVFPVFYVDYWGMTASPSSQRRLVAVAIRYL